MIGITVTSILQQTIGFIRAGAIVLFTAISPCPSTVPGWYIVMSVFVEWMNNILQQKVGLSALHWRLMNPLFCQELQSTWSLILIFPPLFDHPSPASQTRNLDSPQLLRHFLWPGHLGIPRAQPFPFLNDSTTIDNIGLPWFKLSSFMAFNYRGFPKLLSSSSFFSTITPIGPLEFPC